LFFQLKFCIHISQNNNCQIQTNSKAGLGEESQAGSNTSVIPSEIKLTEYPQLKQLAWHIHGLDALTPIEAFGIYDRNWRHLDATRLTPLEKSLIDALKRADAAGELYLSLSKD
jgi:hypothetical protein